MKRKTILCRRTIWFQIPRRFIRRGNTYISVLAHVCSLYEYDYFVGVFELNLCQTFDKIDTFNSHFVTQKQTTCIVVVAHSVCVTKREKRKNFFVYDDSVNFQSNVCHHKISFMLLIKKPNREKLNLKLNLVWKYVVFCSFVTHWIESMEL